jgi:hypothetical protein
MLGCCAVDAYPNDRVTTPQQGDYVLCKAVACTCVAAVPATNTDPCRTEAYRWCWSCDTGICPLPCRRLLRLGWLLQWCISLAALTRHSCCLCLPLLEQLHHCCHLLHTWYCLKGKHIHLAQHKVTCKVATASEDRILMARAAKVSRRGLLSMEWSTACHYCPLLCFLVTSRLVAVLSLVMYPLMHPSTHPRVLSPQVHAPPVPLSKLLLGHSVSIGTCELHQQHVNSRSSK